MAVGEITTLTEPEWASDTISADAPVGATSLGVRNVTPFEPLEAGEVGWLVVPDEAGVEYAEGLRFSEPFSYTAITDAEDDSGTLTIPGGLPVAVEVDDDVWLWDPDATGVDKRSVTMLVYARQDEPPRSQPVPVLVPHEQIAVAGADALLGANVEFDYAGPDDEYPTVTHVYGRDAALDLSKAVPNTLDVAKAAIPGSIPDNAPTDVPAYSPALTVAGTAEALVVKADAVDALSTSIQYHISTVEGFTPDNTTRLLTTRSNVATVTSLPDGTRLQPDVTYYLRSVAVNDVGAADPSAEVAGQLDPTTVSELVLATVTAGIVMAGRFQAGPGYWDPDEGLVLPQPDGTVTRLSTDGITPSLISGFFVAIGMTIKDNLSIYGTAQVLGRMQMSDGVPDPRTPAGLSRTWGSVQTQGWVDNGESHGLCLSPDDRWVYAGTFGGFFLMLVDRSTGETEVPFLTGHNANFVPRGGITRIGSSYYILGEDWDRDYQWYVYRFDATFTKTDEFAIPDNPPARPAIGTDGTNLLIAYCRGNGDEFYVHTYGPGGADINLTAYTHGQSAVFDVAGVAAGSFDFGVARTVIAPAQGRDPFVYNGTTRDAASEFPRAAGNRIQGLTWDGSRFYSLDTAGVVWEYAAGHPTTSSVVGRFTWYDGDLSNGPHETAASPPRSFSWPARTRLTITGQPAPHAEITDPGEVDKANLVRFYAGPTESTTRLQATGTIGQTEVTLPDGLDTGSALAPTVSTFDDSSNAPGWFGSAATDAAGAALVGLSGNGVWRLTGDNEAVTAPLSASSPFSGALIFERVGRSVRCVSGYVARASGSSTGYVATGIVLPAEFRPAVGETLNASTFYNSTLSYRFRVLTTGEVEVQMSGASSQGMIPVGSWLAPPA